MKLRSFFLIYVVFLTTHFIKIEAVSCGFKACSSYKANMINVHLVPHSHDDVGWLKTVDQYYYGSKTGIQRAGVQYILENVVQELLKNSKRRFIYVESAFFFKWFNEQSKEMKKNIRKLVDEGRLEFAGGAWSMNDEAAVHYQSVVDQFTLGLKALADAFGTCGRPRIGWQIDPFGHSREMASIFAQMGFDGQFFARIDWVEKNIRLNNLTGEFIWKASESLKERAELFTGLLYNHYSAPPGFCFDALCSDDPIIDANSTENNVKSKVDEFIDYISKMAKYYRTTHLLVPMGDDFNYESALINFKNMDKLIKYVNDRQIEGSRINVFYSTPACYLNSVHNLLQTWPNKTQDFFPYSSDWHSFWTGYYSSRPTQKRFERDGNHFLQTVKQLTTIANLTSASTLENLNNLRQVMGVLQHHDAITGTEKQRVSSDYNRMLSAALVGAEYNARISLRKLTNLTNGEFESCFQLNISVCSFTRNSANNLVITLFNPLAHGKSEYVRIPVRNESYFVTDSTGREIPSQVVTLPKDVIALSFRSNYTQHELVFQAFVEKVSSYYVKVRPHPNNLNVGSIPTNFKNKLAKQEISPASLIENYFENRLQGDIIVQNSLIKLTFSSSGHLVNVEMNGVSEAIRQDFFYYIGAAGNNAEFKNRSSGAYVFRPNGTEIQINSKIDLSIHNGVLVKEVHQHFNDWISQVIRIYEGVNRIEFEWLIGPIPIDDYIGKEIITRFSSNLVTNGVFWTDSNGREMLRRIKNEREYFKPNMTEEIAGNYYPVTSRIAIQNERNRIAILNDRAQGGSSLKNGSIELMLHRRLLHDDAFGVGEALNETAFGKGLITRGKMYLILNSLQNTPTVQERLAQQEIHLPFWKFFSNASKASNTITPKIPHFSALPLFIQVLTLEPYSVSERLLRLENYMDRSESNSITFNIRTIFDLLGGEEIRETTLDGNMLLTDMNRFKFHSDGSKPNKVEYYKSSHNPLSAKKKDSSDKFTITLDPMQIRTFIIIWK